MSIDDLKLIAKKEAVISTWPAKNLAEKPADVEKDYFVHARTHLSLGDTRRYVDIAFKWVSGANKGAFIGAVLGDYGEGKTSFMIHMWDRSRQQKVCTVPPFEWNAFEDIPNAVAGWVGYVLQDKHPKLARRVQHIHEAFQQQTIEDIARKAAKEQGKQYDDMLATIRGLINSDTMQAREMSADRLLDLVAELTEVVLEAGYEGLLVLLDEPEVAAKKLGNETVQLFLFDLANELNRRQGNYGVFLSMPANFYAIAQNRFAALPARLEVRKCFPRLGDLYGPDFAEQLWNRYIEEFELGEEGHQLVSPLALKAIGQVGSSQYKELSYGPRSVVSTFRHMANRYQEAGGTYEPQQFVQDIVDQEVMVTPEYRSKIMAALRSPDVNEDNRDAVMLLAAFPSGLQTEILRELGIEDVLRPLTRSGGLAYRTAHSMGLRSLRAKSEGESESPLRDMIEEIDGEYAPDRRAFQKALKAFVREVVPLISKNAKGNNLSIGKQCMRWS